MKLPVWGPALGAFVCLGACIAEDEAVVESEATCGDPSAYTPFDAAAHIASASTVPWAENFDSYRTTIECSSTKSALPNLDVTAGCLTAANPTVHPRRHGAECR